jgi:hypothetical protein
VHSQLQEAAAGCHAAVSVEWHDRRELRNSAGRDVGERERERLKPEYPQVVCTRMKAGGLIG